MATDELFRLPDGSLARMPEGMSEEEFAEIISEQFPPGTPVVQAQPQEPQPAQQSPEVQVGPEGTVVAEPPAEEPSLQGQEISQRKPAFLEALDAISNSMSQFTSEVLNTGTFGLSDIVAGAGSALAEELFGGEDADPARAFNVPREQREQFREENPISSGVASFAGAFVNPATGPAGSAIARAPGLISKSLRSAGVGAGFGGGQALGEEIGETIGGLAEGQDIDLRKSGERVAISTGIGGTIGGVVPPVIKVLGALPRQGLSFLRRFSQKGQETRALRKVAEALERDGFTPQQALERIQKLGPEAALIDAGENSRALAFTVAGIPGKGKTQVTKFLRNRQEGIRSSVTGEIEGGQVNRIQDHIDQLVKANFFTEAERLANINNAAKLYTSAYSGNQQVESAAINRILKTPSGKVAFKKAINTLQDLRKNVSKTDPELAAQLIEGGGKPTGKGVGKGLKLEFLDQVKQELWTVEQSKLTNKGLKTPASRAVSDLRRAFTKALDEADTTGGDYAKARLLAGDKLANQEALELGSSFLSKAKFATPEDVGAKLAEMSPEARHLFRVGAAQELKAKLGDIVTRADATKKMIDIQTLEKKVRLAFGDNKKFQQYVELLENEKELFRAVTEVLGNSKTAARSAALDDIAKDSGKIAQGVRDFLVGDFFSGAKNIVSGAKDRIVTSQTESDAIAKILTGRGIKGLAGQVPSPVSPLTETLQPRGLLGNITGGLAGASGSLSGDQ